MASQSQLPFKPLEYWKPPKAVQHIRAKSSSLFTPAGRAPRHSFANSLELSDSNLDKKNMAFSGKGAAANQYQFDHEDSYHAPWYNFRYWGKRAWAGVVAIVVIIIIIVVVVAVEVTKKTAYPDYTQLTYSLSETCMSLHKSPLYGLLTISQIPERLSLTTSTISPATIHPKDLSTTFRKPKPKLTTSPTPAPLQPSSASTPPLVPTQFQMPQQAASPSASHPKTSTVSTVSLSLMSSTALSVAEPGQHSGSQILPIGLTMAKST